MITSCIMRPLRFLITVHPSCLSTRCSAILNIVKEVLEQHGAEWEQIEWSGGIDIQSLHSMKHRSFDGVVACIDGEDDSAVKNWIVKVLDEVHYINHDASILLLIPDACTSFCSGMSLSAASLFFSSSFDIIKTSSAEEEVEFRVRRMVVQQLQKTFMEHVLNCDDLTGVYNRKAISDILRKEVIRSCRYNYPLCVCFVDVNNFKRMNDEMGHTAGDFLLKSIAQVLLSSVRCGVDSVGRYGGDEFLLLLPYLSPADVDIVAERILAGFVELSKARGCTSLAIGCCVTEGGGWRIASNPLVLEEMITLLIRKADETMYLAKERKREEGVFERGGTWEKVVLDKQFWSEWLKEKLQ